MICLQRDKSEGDVCERIERDDVEIEVTPAMIEAGVNCLMSFALPECGQDEWRLAAAETFRAMAAIRKLPCSLGR